VKRSDRITSTSIEAEKMINPPSCDHSLGERETACADGMCPLCMAARLRELEGKLALLRSGLVAILRSDEELQKARAVARAQGWTE
jgi:hypothetical protein